MPISPICFDTHYARRSLAALAGAALGATLAVCLLSACHRGQDPATLMFNANWHQQQGDVLAAVIDLKSLLQQLPDDGKARLMLGKLYLEIGDVLSAEKEFRRASQAAMPQTQVLPQLGRSLLLQMQYQQVLDELPSDLALPDDAQAEVLALRGYALLGMSRPDDAGKAFDQALQRQSGNAAALLGHARLALLSRAPLQAQAYVDKALASHPDDREAMRFMGDLLRRDGKFAEALIVYESLIQGHPANLQARLDAASLLIQQGSHAQARMHLGMANRLAPGSLSVVYTQALLEFHEKRYATALGHLQLVLRAAPDHPPATLLAAAIHYAQDNLPQAEQHARRFLDSSPGHLYASKLQASIALRSGKPAEALAVLEPLLAKFPNDVELLAAVGDAQLRLQDYAKAAAYFGQANARTPDGAPGKALLNTALGASHLALGDHERAITALADAVRPGGKEAAQAQTMRAGMLLAVTQMRAGEYGKALAAVQDLEKQGNSAAVQNLKGGVQLAGNNPEGARLAFEAALSLQPGYLPALQNLGQLDVLAGQPGRARQRYDAALAREPKNTDLMTAQARLALVQGQPAVARSWLERAHTSAPDALQPALELGGFYLGAGMHPKALALAQQLHAATPASAPALQLLAQVQAARADHDAALESYSALARMQPEAPLVQLQLAGAHMALRHMPEALAAIRKALTLQPDNGPAQLTAVRLLTEQHAWDDAMAIARAAQKRHPDAGLGYKLEGDIHMAHNQPEAALPLFDKAMRLEPSGPLAISRHRTLWALDRKALAGRQLHQWLEQYPRDTPTRLYLASVLLASKDYPGAITQYEQIIAGDPHHVVALNDLAWASQQVRDGRAQSYAERAYNLAPANPNVADTLGWVLLEQGQAGRALPLLRQASEAAPKAGDIRLHYASALMRTGDRGSARKQLAMLQADPAYPHQAEVQALLAEHAAVKAAAGNAPAQ